MPRDILNDYGPNSPNVQKARATSGGVKEARDVHRYSPPLGPTNINDAKSPGLHGDNHGMACKPVAHRGSGSVGLHGNNLGKSGTQK